MSPAPTALIADDEPLLRDSLQRSLALLWPELRVVAQARNGREAVEMFDVHRPDIAFLDVHMPGLNGMEAARQIARQAQVVFVTAFEEYALQAFERGAIDYLVKPVDEARLADTVGRLKDRLAERLTERPRHPRGEGSQAALEAVIDELARRMARPPGAPAPAAGGLATDTGPLQWIRASVGSTLKLIPVDEILFLRSDEKYTLVVTAEGRRSSARRSAS
ncbi:LytR/AlgR family response regulator transcription factor [Roseateles chitinivorans]|uniref:LytR/AlgR family response regulator transcription factor n=1 Tax=Roseateles chitinivorans TaxID=2917965 RepID=UPI003D666A23